ncbi:Transcription factor [Nymphaea thermarum]|nr:Transcription factor [Nymphaea thermarum]
MCLSAGPTDLRAGPIYALGKNEKPTFSLLSSFSLPSLSLSLSSSPSLRGQRRIIEEEEGSFWGTISLARFGYRFPSGVMEAEYSGGAAARFFGGRGSGRDAIDQMPETPRRGSHRRAHSEVAFRLPDDFLFDMDADFPLIDVPSFSDDSNSGDGGLFSALLETGKSPEVGSAVKEEPQPIVVDGAASGGCGGGGGVGGGVGGSHMRSLSMDAAFLDRMAFQQGSVEDGGRAVADAGGRPHHRRAGSMDGSPGSSLLEGELPMIDTKKAMPAEKLAELALLDPKRAKRILANRQSAARSKERKIRYTGELERKVQTLQTEATTLSAQLTLLQRDTTGLTAENKELKLRLQAMEQQAHLRDVQLIAFYCFNALLFLIALNEALREELQRLKIATGEIPPVNGNAFNRSLPQPNTSFFHPNHQQLHHFGGTQVQQPQMSPQIPNGQPLGDHSQQNSMDYVNASGNRYDLK